MFSCTHVATGSGGEVVDEFDGRNSAGTECLKFDAVEQDHG